MTGVLVRERRVISDTQTHREKPMQRKTETGVTHPHADEGTTRRGSDTPRYRPEKPAGTTHSSRSDLSPREHPGEEN